MMGWKTLTGNSDIGVWIRGEMVMGPTARSSPPWIGNTSDFPGSGECPDQVPSVPLEAGSGGRPQPQRL